MASRHAAPRPMPKKFSTNGSPWRPYFFIVTRLIAAHRLPPSAASIPSACWSPRRSCGQKSSAVPRTPTRMPTTLRPLSVSLRVQYALKSDVMSGIVENRIAVSPLEMRVSAQ